MQFKEIIGQHKIKEQLIKSVKSNRIPHSQLFTGPSGSGKLSLAIAYAQYLNCEDKKENDSCGSCPSCIKYQKLMHPDLHFVFPVKKASEAKPETSDHYMETWINTLLENTYLSPRKWYDKLNLENKQGIIPTSESARIIKKINFKTYESEYKTMIIWLPERMHRSTANKLLKLIEEPSEKTVFLMVSENSDLILPTILSRTQKIKVPKIDDQNLFNTISDTFDLDSGKAQEIVRLANGSYIKALQYIHENEENQENLQRFISLMRLCFGTKIIEILNWTDEIASLGREKQIIFLQYATHLLRENFMKNLEMEKIVYLTKEENDFSRNFSKFIKPQNAGKLFNEFNKASRDIQMNAHSKTVFLDMSLKIIKLLKV